MVFDPQKTTIRQVSSTFPQLGSTNYAPSPVYTSSFCLLAASVRPPTAQRSALHSAQRKPSTCQAGMRILNLYIIWKAVIDALNSFGRNDARDDLFSTYNRSASPSKSKTQKPRSPYGGGGYGYTSPASDTSFSAYPGASSNGSLYPGTSSSSGGYGGGANEAPFRSATPNSRGQYSAAVLDELESQNDNEHVGILTSKVKQLKDVRSQLPPSPSFSTLLDPSIFRRFYSFPFHTDC